MSDSYFFPLLFNQKLDTPIIEKLKKYKKVYFHHEAIVKNDSKTFHVSNYSDFNQSIDELPDNIEKLFLGYNFNQPINKFPKNLRHLKIWSRFNHDLILPNGLKKLELGFNFNSKITFPNSLEYLIIETSMIDFNNLPINLKFLKIWSDNEEQICLDFLPPNLEYLILDGNFSIKNLPSSMKFLSTTDD